ncbi:hypothetical protein LOK49_LG02G01123 [Camellia lanceoleosa]|uniref:Uncharacterized protein n=1 Tax=Camellia lanceoleosa TaxID=1840588 RepID=A0ACC0IMQ6_9ERIC|nr:hypothetical protein LOK49_LG02G01123 [Camellia lanceoleosa]
MPAELSRAKKNSVSRLHDMVEEVKEKNNLVETVRSSNFRFLGYFDAMTSDMRLGMAQSFRTSRSSFTSNNGYESPSLNPASVSNGEEYDSDGSNFAPP